MEDLNTSLKDDLNIGKNRAAYQDALAQVHEHINLNMQKVWLIQKVHYLKMMKWIVY